MRSKHRCLLAVEVYEFTGDDIGKLRKLYEHDRYLSNTLPTYTFNKEHGNITHADGYLQFVDEGEEKYTLFNVSTIDSLLSEEISSIGVESLLENSDISFYIDQMQKRGYDHFQRGLFSAEYLIIELTYTGGSWIEDDFDMHAEVVGAMVGNNLDIIIVPDGRTKKSKHGQLDSEDVLHRSEKS